MTEQRLRDLLADVVGDVPAPDLVGPAWDRSQQLRNRRRAAFVGAAGVTAGVIVAGAVWLGGDGTSTPIGPPATSTAPIESPERTQGATRSPDVRLAGAPVWRAPDKIAEADLPLLPESASGLPATIDLGGPAVDIRSSSLPRALAAFEVGDNSTERFRELLLLGPGGELRRLDVDDLDHTYVDPEGNRMSVLTHESLSPDGTRLLLRQDGSLMIYDLTAGSWQEISTRGRSAEYPRWTPDGSAVVVQDIAVTVPGDELTDPGTAPRSPADSRFPMDSWWGPARSFEGTTAQAGFLSEGLPETMIKSAVEVYQVIAVEGHRTALFAFPEGISRDDSRWKGCCPVVSWLDEATVAFESRGEARTILAGDIETGRFWRVTTITPAPGTYFYSSYANLMR
jgi:uncharacterized Zn-binding protein involved in type VI secretion